MFGASCKVNDETKRVKDAASKATFKSLSHAAAAIRKAAIASIETSAVASKPGLPPHTRRGLLRRAIVYDVTQDSVVVGPRESIVGTAGEAHEFGGLYRGDKYEKRPFMEPALESNRERFAKGFAGEVTE